MTSANARQLIAILSVGNFMIGMGAFVVVGVLSPVAEHFQISSSDAGFMLTAYALAYTVGSPLCVALSGQYSRRQVLLLGFGIFALGSLLSALAPSATLLNAARVVTALGAGMVTPVAASVALATASAGQQGKALATVFFGLTLAQVIGVPVGSFIGYTFGWQVVFALVACLSLPVMVGIAMQVPRDLPFQVNTLTTLGHAILDFRSFLSVLFTASFIATFYVVYTYLAPVLTQGMGYERDGVTLTLVVFGIGAVLGNILGGKLTDSVGPYRTLLIACASQIVFMPMFSLLPLNDVVFLIGVFVWSTLGWTFMVAQQTRLVTQTPQRQNVVLALNAAAIYLGVSVGSAIGGVIIDTIGLAVLGFGGGICGILGMLHLMASESLSRTRAAK
jgi:predicted MFS family arabinose efflux permease